MHILAWEYFYSKGYTSLIICKPLRVRFELGGAKLLKGEYIEVFGENRQRVVLALLGNYPARTVWIRREGPYGKTKAWPGVLVEAPPEAFETVRKIAKMRGSLREEEAEQLLENPTPNSIERFLSLRAFL